MYFPKQTVNVYKNDYWERWGRSGAILGSLLFLTGLLMQILEIVRIYNGVYANGLANFDFTGNPRFPVRTPYNAFFLYVEPTHFWPWSYAGGTFGLLFMLTGLVGIMSAIRRSYTFLYTFFALSLLSFLFSIFVIVYYSIIVGYYRRYRSPVDPTASVASNRNRPSAGDQSYALVGTNLALSIVALLLSFVSMLVARRGGQIASHRKDYVNVNSIPKYPYYVTA
jgi:hypothetical protein